MTQAVNIDIRPVNRADFPHWCALWRDYLAFYETTLDDDIYALSFERMLSDDPHTFEGRLAYVNERPVGLVHYVFHAHMWKAEPVCYLQDLYATPDARGMGAGRALIETVYAEADAAGAPSVYWMTQDFNANARKLYDRIAVLTPFIKYARRD